VTVKTLTRSFAGGVITPEMFGRLDLTRYQTALAEAVNFVIYPHGPAANRPGTEYVLEVKDSSKATVLLPFIYSTTQAFVLEFGNGYMRFHTGGSTLLEASQNITAITQASPGVLTRVGHGYSNGQTIFLQMSGMTQLNNRFVIVAGATANTLQMTDLAGNLIDTSSFGVFTGGVMSRVYEITTPYLEADLFDLHFTQSADVLTITHPSYQQRELRRLGATNWTLTALSFTPAQAAPTAPVATANGAAGTLVGFGYVITALASDGLEESLQSAEATCLNNLSTAGAFNQVTWTDASGATRYNVYKKQDGLYGYIGQASDGTTGFKDDNVVPDMSKTPPLQSDPFASGNNYPAEVSYLQGRRWFAGTNNGKQSIWATRSGTESNLSSSIPTRDSDAISFRIAARQANTIRHLVPLSEMLILTSGGEWHLSTQNSSVITPSNIDPRQDGTIGASNVRPVTTSTSVIYAQDRGGRLREMQFSWQQQNYKTEDISIMAPHYFDNYTVRQMAFARAPQPIVWCVRSDGVLLGLTYVPEHQVSAWHSHTTDGYFESCCVIPEGSEDVLYVIARRTVNGRTVRYVERLHSRAFTTLADAFFVDSGLTYSGAASATISGLWHLEGETVSILADGAVMPQQTVVAGQVTLSDAATKVHVGIPITAQLKTLPVPLEMQALGQGQQKNVNAVHLRVSDASSISAGPAYDKCTEVKQRTTEPYGSPPSLITGERRLTLKPNWNTDASVCVQQTNPLPITVLSITLEVALGG
jgi:hypothetical protein